MANRCKLAGKKNQSFMACCFMIWCGFGVATTSTQHLLQVSLFSRDIFSGLLILFEMDSTLCLSWPAGVILLRSASPKFPDWAILLAGNGLWQFMLDYGLDNVLFLLMIPCVYGCLCNSLSYPSVSHRSCLGMSRNTYF